jgi:hypothetical protein
LFFWNRAIVIPKKATGKTTDRSIDAVAEL